MKNVFTTSLVLAFLLGGCVGTYSPIDDKTAETDDAPRQDLPNNDDKVDQITADEKADLNDLDLGEVTKDNKMDLSDQDLEKIPNEVFEQTDLIELDVSGNQLTGSIQAEIRFLRNLTSLDASNNMMTGVPAEIGQLQNLEYLDLSNNQLTGLPNELGNLKNLKTLNISGNDYSETDLKTITDKLPRDVYFIK